MADNEDELCDDTPVNTTRSEVFKKKVLQKLYQVSEDEEENPPSRGKEESISSSREHQGSGSPCCLAGSLTDQPLDGGSGGGANKVYTVAPAPKGFPMDQDEGKDGEKESKEESSQSESEQESIRHRRRARKRKAQKNLTNIESTNDTVTPGGDGQKNDPDERTLTKNQKRKLKKKRHKEKVKGQVGSARDFVYEGEGS